MKNILIDSCILFSFFDPVDSYYNIGYAIYNFIKRDAIRNRYNFFVSWPVTYEVINNNFVNSNNKKCLEKFIKFIKEFKIILIDDSKYRSNGISFVSNEFYIFNLTTKKVSLVDYIIRKIIEDKSYRFEYLFTYNLRDFIDLELKRIISIYPKNKNELFFNLK